ncbi:MAG: phosphate/phosphite/phosphonate ABC transporter substrate-binding protein [Woeseiaceae bacterium]
MMNSILKITIACGFLLLAGNVAYAAERVLVIGATHDDPQAQHAVMRPIADYVQEALKPYGIESVEVLVVPNRRQMVNLLRDGRIDWVSETPFAAVYLHERAGAEYLVRKWKDGTQSYRSIFFARKDRGIDKIEDLEDRIVAFEHRNSTSGFFMPASMMSALELTLDGLATPRETPKPETFGYVYSGNEYNTAMWVHKGLVDAGVLSDSDWKDRNIVPVEFLQDMQIFAASEELPRAIELVRGGLDPKLKKALKNVLMSLHEDEAATNALAAYDRTAKFDALTDESLMALQGITEKLPAFREQFP